VGPGEGEADAEAASTGVGVAPGVATGFGDTTGTGEVLGLAFGLGETSGCGPGFLDPGVIWALGELAGSAATAGMVDAHHSSNGSRSSPIIFAKRFFDPGLDFRGVPSETAASVASSSVQQTVAAGGTDQPE
jgi:hypothetical protein